MISIGRELGSDSLTIGLQSPWVDDASETSKAQLLPKRSTFAHYWHGGTITVFRAHALQRKGHGYTELQAGYMMALDCPRIPVPQPSQKW